jgi:hypothetical protein
MAEFTKFGSNHYSVDRNWVIVQRLQPKATKTEPIKIPDQVGVRKGPSPSCAGCLREMASSRCLRAELMWA